MSTTYWLVTVFLSAGMGQMLGARRGALQERDRVNYGMLIAMEHLLSPALYLLNGWNRGNITEDELQAGFKEYAAEKKAKHDAQTDAFIERLNKRSEKEDGA